MFTKSYEQTIKFLGENSPTLDKPTQFIEWAEKMAELVYFIYSIDYDTVTQDILEASKEAQDWEDE